MDGIASPGCRPAKARSKGHRSLADRHKTLAMTMIYARIAGRTVADEYIAVTEKS